MMTNGIDVVFASTALTGTGNVHRNPSFFNFSIFCNVRYVIRVDIVRLLSLIYLSYYLYYFASSLAYLVLFISYFSYYSL